MKRNLGLLLIIPLIAIALLPATSSAGWDPRDKEATPSTGKSGNRAVDTAIARLKAKGPGSAFSFVRPMGTLYFPT